LSVVALTGLAPVKEAVNLRLRTDSQLNLVQVLYSDGPNKDSEYGHIPIPVSQDFYFKFSIPRLADRSSEIAGIVVRNGSTTIGELELLEDVSAIAHDTFEAKKSLILFKTVIRSLTKGLTAHQVKKRIDKETGGGLGGWLAKAAVDFGTDMIENADIRCARLLPGRIYVGDFDIAPGSYDLTVEFIGHDGTVLRIQEFPGYKVNKAGFNLVETINLN